MEAISWTLFLLFLVHLGLDLKAGRFSWSQLKTGAEIPLWGFFFVTAMTALIMVPDSGEVIDITGDNRWILLLYAYGYLLKKYMDTGWEKCVPYFAGFIALVGIYSVVQFFTGIEIGRSHSVIKPFYEHYFRSAGFFSLPLTFAANIGMAGFFLTGFGAVRLLDKYRGRKPVFQLKATLTEVFGSLMAFAGVIVSFTRGAWLAAAVAAVAGSSLITKKIAIGVILALVAGVGSAYLAVPTFQDRIDSVFSQEDRSNNLRFLIWEANWEMIKDHPVSGIGLHQNGTEKYLYDYYARLGVPDEGFITRGPDFLKDPLHNLLHLTGGRGIPGEGLQTGKKPSLRPFQLNHDLFRSHTLPELSSQAQIIPIRWCSAVSRKYRGRPG